MQEATIDITLFTRCQAASNLRMATWLCIPIIIKNTGGRLCAHWVEREPEYFEGHFGKWGSRVYLFHSAALENANIPRIPFSEWYNLDVLSLANVRYIISRKPIEDARLVLRPQVVTEEIREQWWNLPARAKALGYLRGENPGAPMYIYENPSAVDRFFVAPRVTWHESEEALFSHIGQSSISNLVENVSLLKAEEASPDIREMSLDSTDAKIELIDVEDRDEQVLRIWGTQSSWLVFSSLYYPWWKCAIDGESTPVYRAYGTFIAVHVPEGDHQVRFSYEPPYRIMK